MNYFFSDPELPASLATALSTLHALRLHISEQSGTIAEQVAQLPSFREYVMQVRVYGSGDLDSIMVSMKKAWDNEYYLRNIGTMLQDDPPMVVLHKALGTLSHVLNHSICAFQYMEGTRLLSFPNLLLQTGRAVVCNKYPRGLGFYGAGAYHDSSVHRVPLQHIVYHADLLEATIAQLVLANSVCLARAERYEQIAVDVQMNPNTCVRNADNVCLHPEKLTASDWTQLTWRVGYTSFLNVLEYVSQQVQQTPEEADVYLDCEQTIQDCIVIAGTLNAVHELYLKAFVGPSKWESILAFIPHHLRLIIEPRIS